MGRKEFIARYTKTFLAASDGENTLLYPEKKFFQTSERFRKKVARSNELSVSVALPG